MIRKALIDAGLLLALLLLSAFIAGAVSVSRPDCLTCGTTIGLTLWLAGAAALQPVVWIRGLGTLHRAASWAMAMLLGALAWFAFAAAGLALQAGTAFVVAAAIASAIVTGRLRARA